jgi:hypothetical protein
MTSLFLDWLPGVQFCLLAAAYSASGRDGDDSQRAAGAADDF